MTRTVAASFQSSEEGVDVSVEPIADTDAVAAMWQDLQRRADHSFFLSWGWIGCWLRQLPQIEHPSLLIARDNYHIVGLGLLARRRRRRRGFIRSNGLFLNETGDRERDCLTIEYNGFLVDRQVADFVPQRCLEHLFSEIGDWDELYLGGVAPDYLLLASRLGLRFALDADQRCDYIDFGPIRDGEAGYLAGLSRNSRHQVRRAMRRYEERGPIRLTQPADAGEALRLFKELKNLHQRHWMARGQPGAFANPFFERFHEALIAERFSSGEIQLLRVSAGDTCIGCLYNFVHKGRVYAYQSGFEYEPDNRLKPGLVTHYLAIEHNLNRGAAIYDFMAGERQHKASLGTDATRLVWMRLQRDRTRFRIEEALRRAKRRLKRIGG